MRLLIVEDHAAMRHSLEEAMCHAGYVVDCAADGLDADHMLATCPYDLAILDVTLPGISGYEVLRRLRERRSQVPVLMLTVHDAPEERVRGLDLCADDYLGKPFGLPELEARARALVRRGQCGTNPVISVGSIRFDTIQRVATVEGALVEIPAKELAVLEALLFRAGRVVSKEYLLDHVYNFDGNAGLSVIELYIHRLRRRLEGHGISIATVRGIGYVLRT